MNLMASCKEFDKMLSFVLKCNDLAGFSLGLIVKSKVS